MRHVARSALPSKTLDFAAGRHRIKPTTPTTVYITHPLRGLACLNLGSPSKSNSPRDHIPKRSCRGRSRRYYRECKRRTLRRERAEARGTGTPGTGHVTNDASEHLLHVDAVARVVREGNGARGYVIALEADVDLRKGERSVGDATATAA